MKRISFFSILLIFVFLLEGCSSHYKKRQQQRDRVAATSGLFCEFVSGDEFTDIDVEINLRMAKKCDLSQSPSLTSYRNASDNFGIVYCCQTSKNLTKTKVEAKTDGKNSELSLDSEIPPVEAKSKSKAKKKPLKKANAKPSTSKPATSADGGAPSAGSTETITSSPAPEKSSATESSVSETTSPPQSSESTTPTEIAPAPTSGN